MLNQSTNQLGSKHRNNLGFFNFVRHFFTFKKTENNKTIIFLKQFISLMRYSSILQSISDQFNKKNLPQISTGDIVKVGIRIQEGKKQRIQPYSGTVIALHGNNLTSTITVRRIFQGIGIERVFLTHSPCLAYIEVVRHSLVRRSKLYYLRNRVGKAARLKTKLITRS